MAEPTGRYLTFRAAGRLYALPAEGIAEVIRPPAVAKVPQSPESLMGLANLRGLVLPVVSLSRLLGREGQGVDGASRAIILRGERPVALAVERVEALVPVGDDQIETRQAQLASEPLERIVGAFRAAGGEDVAKVLDIGAMLAEAFVARPRPRPGGGAALAARAPEAQDRDQSETLVTFEVAGQEFAFRLDLVREITPLPERLATMPRSEALVLGVTDYRDGLLPLLSLRGLLGFEAAPADGREKVVVTTVNGLLVGLVADRMRSILSAEADLIEPLPSVLAARRAGEAQIAAIYRGEGGRRLVPILSPERLFREDVMQRLGTVSGTARPQPATGESESVAERRYLVFRLGDEEYGLPIEAVDEVASAPARLTRVPKAPRFLEGVINLRGKVLPVVDQRKRFDMPPMAAEERRRLVVVRTQSHRAGLIVDSVSEVLAARATDLEPAPDLAGEAGRLVEGVLNLEAAGRMILVLDPAELLSRAERGLLDAFQARQDGA